jgi:peptidoglycan-associated lipoprotein
MLLVVLLILPAMVLMASCAKKKIYSEPTSASQLSDDEAARARQDALDKQRNIDEQGLNGQGIGAGSGKSGKFGKGAGGGAGSVTRSSFVSEDIYFEFDSASLVAEARDTLKRKADWMRANPDVSVAIEGYTDDRGTVEYNLALGERRAESAKSFLADLGISASRMTTISYGKERPADPGHNETAWAKNRRVHFEIKK